jgi:hypothetical protein
MFPPMPFNNQMRHDYCKRVWNINIRDEWPSIELWGRNISAASNIVFSNGVRANMFIGIDRYYL